MTSSDSFAPDPFLHNVDNLVPPDPKGPLPPTHNLPNADELRASSRPPRQNAFTDLPMKPSKRRTQLALILLGLFGASTGAAAQEAPSQDTPKEEDQDAGEADEDDLSKDLERILHTSWGTPIRARAKQVDGEWQIYSGHGWKALPSGSVESHALVRDIKREARARERKLKMALADDRADQAMWLIDQALFTEALDHREFCLRKDPDHAPTLTLIDSGKLRMNTHAIDATKDTPHEELADALKPWFNKTAFMRRASKEIAVRAFLASTKDIDDGAIRDTLRGELRHRTSARRELAALILHRSDLSIKNESVIQDLIKVAILDGTDEVREECSRTLRDFKQEAITQPFIKALASSSPAIRTNAAGALGTLGFVHAAAPLVNALAATSAGGSSYRPPASHIFVGRQIAYIQDFDVEVAQGSSIADPNINVLTEGAVLDVRVLSVRQETIRVHERAALRGSLKSLLGQDFKYSAEKWEKWMAENPVPE